MATFTATAEEGTNGNTVAVGTWAVVNGSVTYQSAAARMGNLGYRFTFSGTPIVSVWSNALTTGVGGSAGRWRWNMKVSAYPSSGIAMIFQMTAANGSELCSVRMDTAGHLLVYAMGTLVFTSTYVVPLNTLTRCELVMASGGNTTTTGILGFGAVTGDATITTTNSASNAYYYSTTSGVGSSAAYGNFKLGKAEGTSSWTGTMDIDDVAGDNSTNAAKTWTSSPTTWIGKGASSLSSVLVAVSTAGFTIGGRKDILAPTVAAGAAGTLVISGSTFGTKSSVLPVSALSSFSIAPSVSELAVLAMAGGSSFAVSGLKTVSAVLAAAAAGALVVSPVRTQFAVLQMDAGSPAMVVGPLRTQFSVLSMSALGLFSPIPNPGQSQPITLAAVAALSIAGSKALSASLVLAGTGAMALAGSKALTAVLAVRGTPALAVAGLGSRSIVWAARGTPALTVGPFRTALAVWSVRATPTFEILGRVIGDIHPYDNVLAFVIPKQMLAILLPYSKTARLLDNGSRIVRVFDNSVEAVPLASGMLAVIQD